MSGFRKLLAVLLCMSMLFALLPAFAAAENETDPADTALPELETVEPEPEDAELPELETVEPEPEPEAEDTDLPETEEDPGQITVPDEPSRKDNAVVVLEEELVPGTNYFEAETYDTIYYRPVRPTENGYYSFHVKWSGTRYAHLADSELNELSTERKSSVFAFLQAGDTYYFGVSCPNGNEGTVETTLTVYPENACGNNLIWNFDAETGTLSFVGSGDFWTYERDAIPWAAYKDQIRTVDFRSADVKKIIPYAFYNYENLTSALFNDGFPWIEEYAFYGTGIREVDLKWPPHAYSFANCKNLETVTISDSFCGTIHEHAFENSGVKTVTLTYNTNVYSSITIKAYAFANCTDLETADFKDILQSIGAHAFENSGLKTISHSSKLYTVGAYAFANCTELEAVDFGNKLQEIGAHAFENSGLRTISQSSALYAVGAYAFANCPNLITAQLPVKSRTSSAQPGVIAEGVFKNSGIQSLYIPKNVETIEKDALYGCTKLAPDAFTVDPENQVWTANDGLVLTKDGTATVFAIPSLISCSIPFGVQTVAENTFFAMPLLTEVTMQPGVSAIASGAFVDCPALNSVTLVPSVKTVQSGAFTDCGALTDVYYLGTEEERNANLTVEDGNDALLAATWHYQEPCTFDGTVEWNAEDVQFRGATPYMIWTGSALTPRFTLKDAEGNEVDPSTYSYEFRENTNAGTAYLFITFTEGYSGTLRKFFKIYLPATTATTVENRQNGIYLTWKPVDGADGYVIYRRAWNLVSAGWTDFVRWNNTTETTWTDTNVYAGTRYQYGVKAYFKQRMDPVSGALLGGNVGDNYNLGIVGPLKTTVRITTREMSYLKAGSKTIKAVWSGSSVFTGYELRYATDAKFTKNVKTVRFNNPKTTETTLKSLTNGTAYYVAVRSYHVFEGMTYYGQWSQSICIKPGSGQTIYNVQYRALCIGQNNYSQSPLKGCVNDMNTLAGMLKGLKEPAKVTTLQNAKKAAILKAIGTAFADADENDVSVFTYSGHGVNAGGNETYQGALVGVDQEYLTFSELAAELNKVKGHVIVILDSCHSGASISKDLGDEDALDAFNSAAIEAFAALDAMNTKSGELRKSRFTVIAAASSSQSSYDGKFDGSGYYQGAFTAAIVKGMGCRYTSGSYSGSMPADSNKNKQITLNELYNYAYDQAYSWTRRQHAQYYGDLERVLFRR